MVTVYLYFHTQILQLILILHLQQTLIVFINIHRACS